MGYATFRADTAFSTLAGSFSKPNSGEWAPITTRPASLYFAAQAFMYGSSRRLLMHEYVQKLTSTTFPRTALLLNGAELSHATAPSKSGIRPSSPVPDAIATSGEAIATAPLRKKLRRVWVAASDMLWLFDAIRGLGCDHVVLHVDVSAGCQRVRAGVTRCFHQGQGRFLVHTRQVDVQSSRQTESTVSQSKVNFSVNYHFPRKRYLPFAGDQFDRRKKAGGPTGREQLFRVGTGA